MPLKGKAKRDYQQEYMRALGAGTDWDKLKRRCAMATEEAIVERGEEKALTPQNVATPKLTETAIQTITHDLTMAERLVTEALEEKIDYGQIPGVSGKGLWDPGASKIINAFQCYPRHKVLYHEETDTLITWVIETEIIHRQSQQIVGAGVGACSTREPKYKYRWVSREEATRLGYTDPEIAQLKTKKRKFRTDEGKYFDVIEYRVENPEYGEQVNTIIQMAAKRAETDAAKTLPGVASALRKLFSLGIKKTPRDKEKPEEVPEDSPRWTTFWNTVRGLLGENYEQRVHQLLAVKSMKDWLKTGKSLDDAVRIVAQKLAEAKAKPVQISEVTTQDEDLVAEEQVSVAIVEKDKEAAPKSKRAPESIKTIAELLKVCYEDFKLQPKQVYAELNVESANEITELPSECYRRIQAVRG